MWWIRREVPWSNLIKLCLDFLSEGDLFFWLSVTASVFSTVTSAQGLSVTQQPDDDWLSLQIKCLKRKETLKGPIGRRRGRASPSGLECGGFCCLCFGRLCGCVFGLFLCLQCSCACCFLQHDSIVCRNLQLSPISLWPFSYVPHNPCFFFFSPYLLLPLKLHSWCIYKINTTAAFIFTCIKAPV